MLRKFSQVGFSLVKAHHGFYLDSTRLSPPDQQAFVIISISVASIVQGHLIDGKVHSSLQPAQSADKLGSFGANLRRAVGTSGPFVRLAAICCSTQTFVFPGTGQRRA